MKKLARSGSEAMARLKLRVLGYLISLFSGAALSSCFGLYYPPAALYMPPPAERVEVAGLVLDSDSGKPIIGIQVEATDDSTPPVVIAAGTSVGPDGSYDLVFHLYQARNLRLQAQDVDGPSNGSYLDATEPLGTVAYDGGAGTTSITRDLSLKSNQAR